VAHVGKEEQVPKSRHYHSWLAAAQPSSSGANTSVVNQRRAPAAAHCLNHGSISLRCCHRDKIKQLLQQMSSQCLVIRRRQLGSSSEQNAQDLRHSWQRAWLNQALLAEQSSAVRCTQRSKCGRVFNQAIQIWAQNEVVATKFLAQMHSRFATEALWWAAGQGPSTSESNV
jgi:hypothetical protein